MGFSAEERAVVDIGEARVEDLLDADLHGGSGDLLVAPIEHEVSIGFPHDLDSVGINELKTKT